MKDNSSPEQLEKEKAAQDRIRLLEALAVSEKDLAKGRILTHEQAKARLAKWLK
jgi:hypothetical protein